MVLPRQPLSKSLFSLHNSEPFVIFSGGLSYDKAGRRPTLTIMHGKAITVLEMDYPIVEFMVLCETPYNNGVYRMNYSVGHVFSGLCSVVSALLKPCREIEF